MKVFAQYFTSEAANDLAVYLEGKGIETYVESEHGRGGSGSYAWTVFIVLEDQFDDALKVVSDPNHKVQRRFHSIGYGEFERSEDAKRSALTATLIGTMIFAAVALLVLGLIYGALKWSGHA